MADQEAPKIIVDTDWKSQAQAEKERLAAAEAARPAKSPAPGPGAPAEDQVPPRPDLVELIRMLATQSLMYLGAFPDPETGRRMVALELAQYNIELLGVLEEKTKGNLTEEEKTFLSQMLYELRMRFVEISKAVAKAVEEGKIAPMGGGVEGAPDIKIQPAPKM
jgi:hypothetical protein